MRVRTPNYYKTTTLSNATIQGMHLSWRALGFLAYCLSMGEKWEYHPQQIYNAKKQANNGICIKGEGRDNTYELFDELIEKGHCIRVYNANIKSPNLRGKTEYIVFDRREDCANYLNETIKLKPEYSDYEAFDNFGKPRDPENRDPENQDPENRDPDLQDHINNSYPYTSLDTDIFKKEKSYPREATSTKSEMSAEADEMVGKKDEDISKKEIKKSKTNLSYSPEIQDVTEEVIQSLVDVKPDYKVPVNKIPIMQEIDLLLRVDKRSRQRILDVLKWAINDEFWCSNMFKPNPAKYLREKFDQLEMNMNHRPKRKFAPNSSREREKEIAREMERNSI